MRAPSLVAGMFAVLVACASVGHRFPFEKIGALVVGRTTQGEVREVFGPPWRVGYDDGRVTWTYARYAWSPFRGASATDLVVRFDEQGILVSYTYSTTEQGTR